MKFNLEPYQAELQKAVQQFWQTREIQLTKKTKVDQGSRGAVTGGKQLDGFIQLLSRVAQDIRCAGILYL